VRHLRTNTVIPTVATCMTDEELADWTRLNWQARLHLVHSTPCEDCTAEFSAEMRRLNLCNGFPGPQRYCVRCLRWWPDDKQHWATRLRRSCCLVCRRRGQAHATYLRVRADPVRWAARRARQKEQEAIHLSDPTVRARRNAKDRDRRRTRYQTDPAHRAVILARNRAARAKS
jgi:hypothetical protein